jgi:hypothetical protein
MRLLFVLMVLLSGQAFGSEGCDIAAQYAGLGFIDAKNGTPEKNRLEEIDSRVAGIYRKAAEAGMRLGRVLYAQNPKASQGEVENEMRRDCSY